jgi:hypothetical protein
MSAPNPTGPIVDPTTGAPTRAMSAWMQDQTDATGGAAWTIRLKRLSDTTVEVRLLGSDKVWRSNTLTLS